VYSQEISRRRHAAFTAVFIVNCNESTRRHYGIVSIFHFMTSALGGYVTAASIEMQHTSSINFISFSAQLRGA
jgi:hypothetical protein